MPVRELTPTDALAYRLLTSSAFGGSVDPDDPAASAPLSPGQSAVGIDSAALPGGAEGVLAAAARIRHDEISLGGGRVHCGGVAGLAVHPAHRGDGLFAELLAAVLARCDEESLPVSMLYPSNPEIYRRHGYQVIARAETLEVPLVMMRVVDTAALLEARPAPTGLSGALRLEVTDDTVPAGTCRAEGLFDVHVADGRVRAVPVPRSGAASAQSSTGPSPAPSGEATAATVLLDVHAASLLLVGGRSLADARRLGLRAEADAPAESLLDALLAGPRPSVLDAF